MQTGERARSGGAPGRSGEASASPRPPSTPPELWGVLNVTPDSFSDGGLYLTADRAVARAHEMVREGAAVIDVGGESSRPAGRTYGQGADAIPLEEELRRVVPVVERLAREGVRVSVDTVKADVAQACLDAGAQIVNDVSSGRSEALLATVGKYEVDLVLMHNRGRGEVDARNTTYGDVVETVLDELMGAVERAVALGVARERIWIDPGIGFAKTAAQSVSLLARTADFVATGHRVLVGPSRKSFIAEVARAPDGTRPTPEGRMGGTAAAVTAAVLGGAHALRVHDVATMHQAVAVADAIARGAS